MVDGTLLALFLECWEQPSEHRRDAENAEVAQRVELDSGLALALRHFRLQISDLKKPKQLHNTGKKSLRSFV